jgi:hypothetical protein
LGLLPLPERAISYPRLTVLSQLRGLLLGGFGHIFPVMKAW